jgi:Glycosyl transferases group 1
MTSNAEPYPTLQGIHFWIPEVPSGLGDWHPDADPQLFASGVGHNILELFVRLRLSGASVSIGPKPPSGTRTIVVYPVSVRDPGKGARFLFAARNLPVMIIRSDFGSDSPLHVQPDMEVMPNRSCISRAYQTWIPPLPQRGLIRRSPARKGRITSVGYKGNKNNLPEFARTPGWSTSLEAAGLKWVDDIPRFRGSSHHTWHDFSSIDVTLCLRSDGIPPGIIKQKPATKLINSWLAGCIPIVSSEPGYLELLRDGKDGFVCDDPDAVLKTLAALRANPELVHEIEFNIEERAKEFEPQRVLREWVEAMQLLARSHVRPADSRRRLVSGLRLAARAAPGFVNCRLPWSRPTAARANEGWMSRPST